MSNGRFLVLICVVSFNKCNCWDYNTRNFEVIFQVTPRKFFTLVPRAGASSWCDIKNVAKLCLNHSWTRDNSEGLKLTGCTKGWSCLWSWWIWLHSCSTQNLELAALSAAEKDNAMVDACKILSPTQRLGWAAFYKALRVVCTLLIWEGQYCLHSLHNAMADAWKTPTACEHCVQPCTSRR